jgi:hypothetical protein
MGHFARRPSPATVIATVALFVALGGAAGALKGQNKVNNGDVKDLKYKNLTLINGWSSNSGSYTAAAALDAQGIVHLRGAVAQGIASSDTFAVLPGPLRPDESVSLVIDIVAGNQGRLSISPNGEATLAPEQGGPPTGHKLFSSLDGVTYEAGG